MSLPLVAIVGAPNVGKSTLFNRLIRRRQAIVTDEPGVTRDRQYGEVVDETRPFRVVDTGGMTPGSYEPFAREIELQAEIALEEAAVILFVVDARAGVAAFDQDLATLLRRRRAPLVLVANKIDGEKSERLLADLYSLGLGEPFAVSSEHGRGVGELVDRVLELLDETVPQEEEADEVAAAPGDLLRVAIVGRPNVGKSSLLNRLAGEERSVVSDIPGTTRDSVDSLLEVEGHRYRLIDTAGIRRRGKIDRGVERFSVDRARKAIDRCDVAVLVLDATEELAAQDLHIAGHVIDAHRPLVVAVNKWDAVSEREAAARAWEERVQDRLRFAKQVPMVLISALSGQRVQVVLERVREVWQQAGIWISTPELNRWVERLGGVTSGRGVNLLYGTQKGVHPPRFVFFCNDPKSLHFSTRRHLENSLRDTFEFGAAPLRLEFRGRRSEKGRKERR